MYIGVVLRFSQKHVWNKVIIFWSFDLSSSNYSYHLFHGSGGSRCFTNESLEVQQENTNDSQPHTVEACGSAQGDSQYICTKPAEPSKKPILNFVSVARRSPTAFRAMGDKELVVFVWTIIILADVCIQIYIYIYICVYIYI